MCVLVGEGVQKMMYFLFPRVCTSGKSRLTSTAQVSTMLLRIEGDGGGGVRGDGVDCVNQLYAVDVSRKLLALQNHNNCKSATPNNTEQHQQRHHHHHHHQQQQQQQQQH